MQCIERLARGVSLGRNAGKLTPTSVQVLRGLQCLDERGALRGRGPRVAQSVELHGSLFLRGRLGGEQPPLGARETLLKFFAASWDGVASDRAQRHSGGGERSVLR